MTRVLTVGTFDLFHQGHINLLRTCYGISGAAEYGQTETHSVTVGLNTDEFIEKFKGTKPIQTLDERRAPLVTCRYVWSVHENKGGSDLKPLIESEKPNYLVVGSDWAKKDYYAQTQLSKEYLYRKNVVLLYVEYTKGISSSLLKERIIRSG